MKYLLSIILACWFPLVTAAEVVTLKDGRQIQLNDDFTWHYLALTTIPKSASTQPTAAPLITTKRYKVELNDHKPSLQISESGIDIVLGSARYRDGKLILPTAITNQSTQSVINIRLAVTLWDEQGVELTQQTVTIWQSIKRMADTYLRPKSSVAGKAIEVDVPFAERYQLMVTLSQLETR
ncbi:DUF3157 family protein [Vibrio cincinnatiensis]|uniref:DUF3157 family protein n=1 Tax=Vibrio cincinnatiensis TaxID=675 RepID=UPI001EE0118C|nr:DUF3157 family protein [Vibrio cincinnatiensis]MCG3726698.1 DUF3157 family protein [Vibrio cincinnatiensis]MCG3748068.1 DUF3157 family protein [Vibrio cincinnatiensis]MCG3759936.1 DUF3157 family protein [Vibrio cincinnatiensis]MCG3763232.1 DUF3157 family protein [Vibrio cincinnatiensis]MCG3767411.1 DUF3157 family protein [Vibrio cincinnatiensis]